MKKSNLLILALAVTLFSCSSVEPNFEGVLMENYGRNGKQDFKSVTGRQWTVWAGTSLYQVPMFEQKADPASVKITTKDASTFDIDPTYTYNPIRGKGVDIIFNYKHVGVAEPVAMMDNIEGSVLNQLVTNAYREEARTFSVDSIMGNLNAFEKLVEERLKREFEAKFFSLTNLTSGLTPPESMAKAIELRNNAIQQAAQVKNELEVSRMRLEKAKIEAEENRVRSEGLSAKNLTEKWIEALRTTSNKVIITDGKTPILLGQ